MQAGDLSGAQRSGFPEGMDPRTPERLDGVNVPDARDRPLIEEQHLDGRPRTAAQQRAQPRDRKPAREGLRPKRRVKRHLRAPSFAGSFERRGVDDGHAPELAGVGETHRGPVHETDLPAHVALVHVGHSIQKLAGHTERHDQRLAAVEVEHHELPAAPHVADASTAQTRAHDLGRLGFRETHPARLELADGAIDHEPTQLPGDGLDFR